jgi:hypothetical protein
MTRQTACHSHRGSTSASLPSDVRDVAVVFHSHCLSPFRFYADIKHRATRQHATDLWDMITFPLARLHRLLASDEWSDEASERMWFDMFRIPYQVWRSNPLTTRCPLELPNIRFPCPLCQIPCEFDPALFTQYRITKLGALTFPCCGNSFTVDSLAAIQLREDMQKLSDNASPWYVLHVFQIPILGKSKELYLNQSKDDQFPMHPPTFPSF